MDPRQSFSVLDLPMDATREQARQAYRDLVNVWHPDRYAHNPRLQKRAEEKVKEINAAYAVVSALLDGRPASAPADRAREASGKPPAPKKKNAREKSAGTADRTVDWKRTEALLASLKRAKTRAEIRERDRARKAAEARAREAADRAEEKRRAAEADRKAREARERQAERRTRETEAERLRQWKRTEARLRAMLNRPTAPEGVEVRRPATRPARFWGYLIQWLLYTAALFACFSVNIVQDFYRFDIFAIVGFCLAAVLVCRRLLSRSPLAKFMARGD